MTPARTQWGKPARAQQSCATCNAWTPNRAANPAAGQVRQGWCRAAPPVLIQTAVQVPGSRLTPNGPQMMPALQGAWPPSNADAWCRGYEPEDDDGNTRPD